MKKMIQSLLLTFVFVLMSATGIVYATEAEDVKLEVSGEQILNISEEVASELEYTDPEHVYHSRLREPATQVTDIQLVGIYLTPDNRFLARVLVVGYGRYTAKIDGATADYLGWYDTIGYSPVTAWYEEFDLGTATSGSHTFSLSARSYNFPYSTVSRSWNFTY